MSSLDPQKAGSTGGQERTRTSDPQLKLELRLDRAVVDNLEVVDRDVLEAAAGLLVEQDGGDGGSACGGSLLLCLLFLHGSGPAEHLVGVVHVAVVDLLIGDEVGENAGLLAGHAGDHHLQDGVLDLVDAAGPGGGEHVAAALDHAHVQVVAPDVPHGQEGTGGESGRLVQVDLLPEGDDLAAAVGVFFNVLDQVVDQVIAADRRAVALADGAVADVPGIPPGHALVAHLGEHVGGVLVDGEDLADAGLPGLGPQGTEGKLALCQVVFAHDVVDTDRVGGRPVLVDRAGIFVHVAIFQYILNVPHEIAVCFCHHDGLPPCFLVS